MSAKGWRAELQPVTPGLFLPVSLTTPTTTAVQQKPQKQQLQSWMMVRDK
jgi:hypothetical protein